jgi:transposase
MSDVFKTCPCKAPSMTVKIRVSRWRCLNGDCERRTFADQPSESVSRHARRTRRIAEFVHLFGHGTGGRLGERLMKRLGMPVSDDTILRQLKKHVAAQGPPMSVRVAGVDDRSWRKGCTYGTIVVDLERREVVDALRQLQEPPNGSQHPEVEINCHDRCGLYARGAREGAPQARHVADIFEPLGNCARWGEFHQ